MKEIIMHSRRRFLRDASLTALAGMLPIPGMASGSRVIVVGAGLSGLYAAMLLERQGIDVTVLEAREAVGGRVRTLDHIPGRPEAGANEIGPNYGRNIDAALRLGVPLDPPERHIELPLGLMIDNQWVDREKWPGSPLNTLPGPLKFATPDILRFVLLGDNPVHASTDWRKEAFARYDVSAAEFFRKKGLDERALKWVQVDNTYGNTLEDTSLLPLYRSGFMYAESVSMKKPLAVVRGGNLRLPEAMAASLKNPPVLGQVINRIRQSASSVKLECESGNTYEAEFVICTVPASVVNDIEMDPPMPAPQEQAYREVDYHKCTQVYLLATEPYWKESKTPSSIWTDGPLERVFTRVAPNSEGIYNLTVWMNGDACDPFDAMDEEEVGPTVLAEFEKMVPEAKGLVSVGGTISWAREPFNKGTWAVWKPGQIHRIPELLQTPHRRVFFAGEHLGVANLGMENAMESGETAAMEVLRRLL